MKKIMKKLAIMAAILCLSLAAASCGTGTTQSAPESASSSSPASGEKTPASYVEINGVRLSLGAAFTQEDEAALGEPDEVLEAPSCHFDGNDSLYYYPGFTLYTYMDNEEAILYSVELSDVSHSTPEGAAVGMTLDEVKALCGDGFEETETGLSYSVGEGMELNFRAQDNVVSIIEYYMEA